MISLFFYFSDYKTDIILKISLISLFLKRFNNVFLKILTFLSMIISSFSFVSKSLMIKF